MQNGDRRIEIPDAGRLFRTIRRRLDPRNKLRTPPSGLLRVLLMVHSGFRKEPRAFRGFLHKN